uniref:C6 domain-containing protein n=1 Tax=Elaeophora elaphi TaxID=1147741 RepID=A0A0R3S6R1_9BILA
MIELINHKLIIYILAYTAARCSDLILYPVKSVDQDDQYRFDYSDVSFGNTHSLGATVAITCTEKGQPATVEGYDQQRTSITSSPSLMATCTNVGGSQYTWATLGRILQFVDCRF